jgi:hypothetical protein
MCNGLNGWICSNDKETLITKIRNATLKLIIEIIGLTRANRADDEPCDIRVIVGAFTRNIQLNTLSRDNVLSSIQKCEDVAFNTAIDAADIVFKGANGEDNIRRLSQQCSDFNKISKLKPIGKRLHPRITLGQRLPIKNQIANLRTEDDVTNDILNPVYPTYEFLKQNIDADPNYLSPDSINWVLTKYETQCLKGAPFHVYIEITDKMMH